MSDSLSALLYLVARSASSWRCAAVLARYGARRNLYGIAAWRSPS